MVAQAPVRTLYTEDDLTLTCTIELNEAVDTEVVVTVVWIGPNGALSGTAPSAGSSITYQSIFTVTSLEMSDSGAYTCAATATGNGTTFVTESQGGSATTTVQFVGKVHLIIAIILYCSPCRRYITTLFPFWMSCPVDISTN